MPVLLFSVVCFVPAEGRAAGSAQATEPPASSASREPLTAEAPPAPRRVPSAADTGDGFDGQQWRAAGPAGIGAPLALAVDPEREDRVYLATTDGLYASRDGGRGWSVTALPGVAALALSPSDPRHLMVVADGGAGRLRLWRSADRGASWRPGGEIAVPAGDSSSAPVAGRDGTAATPRILHAAFHPDRADLLYLAGSVGAPAPRASVRTEPRATTAGTGTPFPPPPTGRLWVSRDGGDTLTGRDLPTGLVPRHLLVRRDGTLLAATAAGVWRSTDDGRSWQPSRLGLEGRSAGSFRGVLRLAASADAPEAIYAGTATGPGARGPGATAVLFSSADGGATWSPLAADLPPGDVADLVVDPRDSRSLWVAVAGGGVHATRGGGWQAVGPTLPEDSDPSLLGLGPDHPRTLWAATPGGDLYRRAPPSPECVDDATTLCLAGRFRVDVSWWGDAGEGEPDPPPSPGLGDRRGRAVPLTAGAGWFWLDRPEHPAVAVEAVPVAAATEGAGTRGEDPAPTAWRVRATALTAAGVDVRVFDVESGRFESFRQAEGGRDGATHRATFPALPSADGAGDVWFAALPEGGCSGESIDLCLHDGRFEVRVDWYDGEGAEGAAVADRLSDAAGWFRFRRPDEPELFVTVVDARRRDGHWSVVLGALTDLGFELTVTDRESGETVAYGVEPGDGGSHRDRRAFAEAPPG